MIDRSLELFRRFVNRETVAYLICGGLTTVLGLSIYSLCIWQGYNIITANTVSTVLAVIFAYITNKIFVFRASSWAVKTLLREVASFSAGRLVTYLGETGLLMLLVEGLHWPAMFCKLFTMVLVIISNYFISKLAVFKK